MKLTYLLDTSILCQPIRDQPVAGVLSRWSEVGDAAVCTSAICLAEVLQGLEQRNSEKYWRRYRSILAGHYTVLPVDERVAARYGRLSAELRALGRPRPVLDLFIAATCLSQGLTVVTLNRQHFEDIPGLNMEDWSAV